MQVTVYAIRSIGSGTFFQETKALFEYPFGPLETAKLWTAEKRSQAGMDYYLSELDNGRPCEWVPVTLTVN